MSRTTDTPPSQCPHCAYRMDSASDIEGNALPQPGDWTICLRCAGVLVFDAALRAVLPAPGAFEALAKTEPKMHAQIARHRAAVRWIAKKYPIPQRPAGPKNTGN